MASASRFSASRIRFAMVVKQMAVIPRRNQPVPPAIDMRGGKKPTPLNSMKRSDEPAPSPHRPMNPNPIKTTADIALDVVADDKNRHRAHTHIDHMNSTPSETRIVCRSMPPSRKLIV